MIGTQEQKFFTLKDVPAADFIRAYADFLKKNNKLERPVWADFVKTSKGTPFPMQLNNLRPWTTTGSISELLRSPERSSSDPELESGFCNTSTDLLSTQATASPTT